MDSYKKNYISSESEKLKNIIDGSIKNNDSEQALAAISVLSYLYYEWNQFYTDDFIEDKLKIISEQTCIHAYDNYVPDENVVLFYDDFGLDTRGLALIYIKGILAAGFKLVYLTTEYGMDRQSEIDHILQSYPSAKKVYFSKYQNGYYTTKIRCIQEICNKYRPSKAFLYTTPWDSSGVTAFMQMQGITRYLINLTDHAFWIGRNAIDYCIEFRDYGGSISVQKRKIPQNKIVMLPYYPYCNKDIPFEGFPFDTESKKIIFSGGGLYKTLGYDGLYYKMIARILNVVPDAVFLYAGEGDTQSIDTLIGQFPDRVYYIHERKDLYQLLKRITIYINTFPMAGGLMTQYAAMTCKIPLTIQTDSSFDDVLLKQEDRHIIYINADDLVNDAIKLLNDDSYRKEREEYLIGSVISENEFDIQVRNILADNRTDYIFHEHQYDTDKFRQGYIERFKPEVLENIVVRSKNVCLYEYYKDFGWNKKKWFSVYTQK